MNVRAVPLIVLLLASGAATAEMLVREFSGIGRTDTGSFTVESPWLVAWSSRPPTAIDHKPAHLEVHLYNAATNEFVGRVLEHAGVGRGDVLIEHSGRFLFKVQGQATEWRLKVIKVDEDYAERLRKAPRDADTPPQRR
ncbi:MAG TPA: hypothetical protein VMQ83_00710 [Gammaproteobacteria bacterium]|nr:hypothetical protein [Gammaproteobacteria bacterium]